MRTTYFFLLALIVGSAIARAAPPPHRLAVLAGASGEPGDDNFLIQDLRGLRKQLVARGWKVSAAVGARAGLLPGSRPALNAEISKTVRDALAQARAGDEVLLLFHGHGRERESDWGQRSHSLVSEDLDSSGYDPGYDLDLLEAPVRAAGARGVQVAFVDLSCYSGASQALQSKACTVSLAASDYVSLCSGRPEERLFNSAFFALPKPGQPVDIETQFLKARRQDLGSINLPQISSRTTPAAPGWDDFLRTADPLDVNENLKRRQEGAAVFEAKRLLDPLDAAIKGSSALAGLRGQITQELSSWLETRKKLEASIPDLSDFDDQSIAVAVPGRGTLELAPSDLADLLEHLNDPHPGPDLWNGFSQAEQDLAHDLRPMRERVERENADVIKDFRQKRSAFEHEQDELETSAGRLFNHERELYDRLSASVSDQCRKFAL